jgi:acetylornithine deacetylase
MSQEKPPRRRLTQEELDAKQAKCPHLVIELGHCEWCFAYVGDSAVSDRSSSSCMLAAMDVVALTRRLVDIESITGNEHGVASFLMEELLRRGFETRRMPVESGGRDNIVAVWPGHPNPDIVFSTHTDTVPPFIASSEDEYNVYGRGSCDAKGIIAVQIVAAERLRNEGVYAGLLFLVGEERNSLGAKVANTQPIGSRYLINGEPTENCIGVASKGSLRAELVARGRMAHSAYPQLGESAIDKLVEALSRLRAMRLPEAEGVGACTMNVGVIEGGRAPNVIPDHARAQLLYRLVGPSEELRSRIMDTVGELAEVQFVLDIPFMKLRSFEDLPSMVAAFTTDIPALGKWGEPLLIGPGSIHVAHTEGEYVTKKQLSEAIEIYCAVARKLSSA